MEGSRALRSDNETIRLVDPISFGCDSGFGVHMDLWHLVRPEPNHDQHVAEILIQRGVPVYMPMAEYTYQDAAGKKRRRVGPLFSSYVFAASVDIKPCHRVRDVDDIKDQFGFACDLHKFHAVYKAGVQVLAPCDLIVGERVRVNHDGSCLDGLTGVVNRIDHNGWIYVSLDAMKTSVPVAIQSWRVEPLPATLKE